jgi:hypothetical protein
VVIERLETWGLTVIKKNELGRGCNPDWFGAPRKKFQKAQEAGYALS